MGANPYLRIFAYVTMLSPDLEVLYSTFLTQGNLQPASIAVDSDGAAVIAGTTYTTNCCVGLTRRGNRSWSVLG